MKVTPHYGESHTENKNPSTLRTMPKILQISTSKKGKKTLDPTFHTMQILFIKLSQTLTMDYFLTLKVNKSVSTHNDCAFTKV